jgi:hypothetical protein
LIGLYKISNRELCPAGLPVNRGEYFGKGQIEFGHCNCRFCLMRATSALREVRVAILINDK